MFKIKGIIGRQHTIAGKNGKRDSVKIDLVLMGQTLSFWVPEQCINDAIEGSEVEVDFDLRAGKWNAPEVRTIAIRQAQ